MRPWCAVLLSLGLLAGEGQAPPKPVLVELFTSEGSSNCPAADQLLSRLQRDQPVAGVRIVPLSIHVDIWDAFGWKDPFASPLFTQRQVEYNKFFEDTSTYTPEMVVDGAFSLVGSLEQQALTAIERMAKNPKVDLILKRDGRDLTISVPDTSTLKGAGRVAVWLAITEDGLESDVKKGENAGKHLVYASVLRSLLQVGSVEVGQAAFSVTTRTDLPRTWKKENLRAIAFLQSLQTHHVLGVADMKL